MVKNVVSLEEMQHVSIFVWGGELGGRLDNDSEL